MEQNFDTVFSNVIMKEVVKLLTGDKAMTIDLEDIYTTSVEVLSFDSTDQALIENADFVKAFGIARVKAREFIKRISN